MRYTYDRPEGASHRRAWDQVWSDDVVLVDRVATGRTRAGARIAPALHWLLDAEGETLERPYYREELQRVKEVDKRVRATDA